MGEAGRCLTIRLDWLLELTEFDRSEGDMSAAATVVWTLGDRCRPLSAAAWLTCRDRCRLRSVGAVGDTGVDVGGA